MVFDGFAILTLYVSELFPKSYYFVIIFINFVMLLVLLYSLIIY